MDIILIFETCDAAGRSFVLILFWQMSVYKLNLMQRNQNPTLSEAEAVM